MLSSPVFRPAASVRVATLNLWFDVESWPERLKVMSAQLLEADVDVVCYQEVVVFPGGGSMAEDLAGALGTDWVVLGAGGWQDISGGGQAGVAILSRVPSRDEARWMTLPGLDMSDTSRRMLLCRVEVGPGAELLVATTHLAWGGPSEATRFHQAAAIDSWFSRHFPLDRWGRSPIPTVLCGDFNATPTSDTLRFLRGEAVSERASAFWMDAWELAGDGSEGFTQSLENAWLRRALRLDGSSATPVWSRRLDFVLCRGFVVGQPGMPVAVDLVCDRPNADGVFASDHFGVVAEIAL